MASNRILRPSTIARPQRGDETSPYLLLPPEVRVEIMLYHFGVNIIHVFERDGPKASHWWPRSERIGSLDHRICLAAYENVAGSRAQIDIRDDRVADITLYQRRHQLCRMNHYDVPSSQGKRSDPGPLGAERMDLSLCFVNKHIHREAQEVFWNTQAVSFIRADTFETFCARMVLRQKNNLRKLELSTAVILKKDSSGETSCE